MVEKKPIKEMLDKDDKLQFVNCSLCGSDNFKVRCFYNDLRIVQCRDCGLIYRNPRFKGNINREFYSFVYYAEYEGMEERISSVRVALYKHILKNLDKKISSEPKRLLDIGCGQGHFLRSARDSGWQVQGVELAKSACDYAKKEFGIDIINKSIEEANLKDNFFDAVTLWNVLDHLLDPLSTLNEARRLLKPNGILVVRVPNVNFHLFLHNAFLLFGLESKKNGLRDPSVIVNYGFSSRTIKRILQKAGFHKIEVYNSPLTYGDPYESFRRYNTEVINLIKNIYYFFSRIITYLCFKNLFINSSLLIYAIKKDR